jgi:hypothetical protein
VRIVAGAAPTSATSTTVFELSAASPGLDFPLFFSLFPFSGDFFIAYSTYRLLLIL